MATNEVVVNDPNKLAESWIKKYGDSAWVKSIVASLPIVGAFLDSHFNSMANEIYQGRINSLFHEIHSEISFLKDKAVDHSYLSSEEFFDLTQNAFSRIMKIADIDRTSAIARVIAECIMGEQQTTIPPFDLVNVIGEMSPSEALMFGEIGKIYLNRKDLLSGSSNTLFVVKDIESVLPSAIQKNAGFLCARLESKGLLGSIFENYGLEPAGEELLKYFQSQCL
ncbi:hypothetical protein LQK65_004163 [Vibrio parahaemolyticus]|uniref:hypothetical protein n=1 Tax=Vibrio parahaemolyticus TaxID=670 RepID=UPI00235DDC24|nr:hypothetical protein [Vibrio parahaemolyticus]EIO4083688.1 hypothetical protein [Vibrio parahaemolyticus]MDF4613396.1 hypothetical protein [Vibrio parahaemolyticus]